MMWPMMPGAVVTRHFVQSKVARPFARPVAIATIVSKVIWDNASLVRVPCVTRLTTQGVEAIRPFVYRRIMAMHALGVWTITTVAKTHQNVWVVSVLNVIQTRPIRALTPHRSVSM